MFSVSSLFLLQLFHIIAPVATGIEKRVSATVPIYGNTLFSDSSDEHRWKRKISISATGATVYFFKMEST